MTRIRFLLLPFCLWLFAPNATYAQNDDEAARLNEARSLFEQGRDKLEAGQAAEAAIDFERSLALSERSATRFNFAIALCDSGHYVEGIEQYELLLRTTDLSPDKRNEVIERKAEAETKLSRIALTNRWTGALTVFVDDEERSTIAPSQTIILAVNPGVHEVLARSPEGETERRKLTTHSGQTETHNLEVETSHSSVPPNDVDQALVEPVATQTSLKDAGDDGGPVWPWIVLGVAAVGGIAVAAVLLSGGGGDDEDFDAHAETLNFRF